MLDRMGNAAAILAASTDIGDDDDRRLRIALFPIASRLTKQATRVEGASAVSCLAFSEKDGQSDGQEHAQGG
jgi:hypothetical protein